LWAQTRGPYRYFSHPNYLVVIAEIAVLPLCLGLPWVALIFTVLNGAVLTIRIKAEKPNGLLGLCLTEVLVGRTRDVVVPRIPADRIQHDPLKAVVIPNRPMAFLGASKRRHDNARQMQILLDKRCIRRFGQKETALH